jgi:hypothetical protein
LALTQQNYCHISWLTGWTSLASIFSYASLSAFTNSGNTVIVNHTSNIPVIILEKAKATLQQAKKKSMGKSSK